MPNDPQPLIFPSDSTVGDVQCVSYQTLGDDFKEEDTETLIITLEGENLDDIISNPSPQIFVTIEDGTDCKMIA